MLPEFMLSGGQGGMTISPSSSADSGRVSSNLNFGNSGSGLSNVQVLLIGGVALGAILLWKRG